MKPWLYVVLVLVLGSSFCKETPDAKLDWKAMEDQHPIQVVVKEKKQGNYQLELLLPANYGFQKEAPHRLVLTAGEGVEVLGTDFRFEGPTHPKKLEYFEYLQPLSFTAKGLGSVHLDAKLFYCDFQKNICIPGKIQRTIDLKSL